MRIKKIINNNILSAVDDKGCELIVTGRGIGFQRCRGEQIDPATVEHYYRMEDKAEQRKLRELVEKIPMEHLELTESLIAHIRGHIPQKLNESLLITLADHVSFAIARKAQGIAFSNPLKGAVMCYYPAEYQFGRDCLKVIRERLGVELLMHIGIDTVKLGGKYFEAHVQPEQQVKKGDLLVSFDMEAIRAEGYPLTTPLIVCNTDDYTAVETLASGEIQNGADLLQIR